MAGDLSHKLLLVAGGDAAHAPSAASSWGLVALSWQGNGAAHCTTHARAAQVR